MMLLLPAGGIKEQDIFFEL